MLAQADTATRIVDRSAYSAALAIGVILLLLATLKTASLIHGLRWLFNQKSHEVGIEAQSQMAQGGAPDWEWLEKTRGHTRLFDRTLKSIRPVWLKRTISICWRAYIVVPITSIYCLGLISFPHPWRANGLVLAVAVGCLIVALLTLLHEGFKWLRWTDADIVHWANSLPGPFEQWRVAESRYGRMIANWVVLVVVGAFGFAVIYGALYAVDPAQLTRSGVLVTYGVPDWLVSGISYGTSGVTMDGPLGSYLHVLQLFWGFLVLVVVPVTYLARGNG